jgi:PAS domain S-box-containing protein
MHGNGEHYRVLLDHLNEAVAIIDAEGIFRFMNDSAAAQVGGTPENYIGKSLWDIFPPQLAERFAADVRRVIETQKGLTTVTQQPLRQRLRWHRSYVEPLRDASGQVTTALLIADDITDSKVAEEKRREAEDNYRTLVEQLPAITYTAALDRVGLATFVSPQVTELLGFTPDECRADPDLWCQQLHPEDRDRVLAEWDQCRRTGAPFACEYRLVARDGQIKWFRDAARLVRQSDGLPLHYRGLMLDITRQKSAQESARQTDALFHRLFFRSPIGKILCDSRGLLTNANGAALEILGLSELRPILGHDLFADPQVPPEARSRLEAGNSFRYETAYDFERVRAAQLRDSSRSGIVHLDIVITPLTDGPAGERTGFLIQVQDITKRKRMELSLRESHQEFEDLLRAVDDGVWAAAPDGKYLYLNAAMERIYGRSRAEFLANPNLWLDVIYPEDQLPARSSDAQLRKTGRADLEYRILHPDGTVRWVRDRKTIVRNPEGRALRIGGIVRDVTDRRLADEQAEQYRANLKSLATELTLAEERERRRLAASLHDNLVQLLGLIQIKLSLLRKAKGRERSALLTELDALAERSVGSSRSLTRQLSHPGLYDQGFLAGAQWLAEDIQSLYGVAVSIHDDGRPKPIDEPARVVLFQCLREALANAAKHARVSKIRVRIACGRGMARVTVRDPGIGFDLSTIPQRSPRSFGLFSIRQRLEHLGGRFAIRTAPGKGTAVLMAVPLSAPPSPSQNAGHTRI